MRPFIFLLFLSCASVQAADEHHEHHGQGQGKSACDAYSWDMAREFNLLRATPHALSASRMADPDARYVPLDRKLDLSLLPGEQVKLLEKPVWRDPHVPR